MRFKELYWDNPSMFQENMLNLGYNIFKIKYFYEEDQLPKLSRQMMNPEHIFFINQGYQEASDEAEIYLKSIVAFRNGDAVLPKDQEYFEYILNYFHKKEEDLANFELDDEDRFWEWLENKEYTKRSVVSL